MTNSNADKKDSKAVSNPAQQRDKLKNIVEYSMKRAEQAKFFAEHFGRIGMIEGDGLLTMHDAQGNSVGLKSPEIKSLMAQVQNFQTGKTGVELGKEEYLGNLLAMYVIQKTLEDTPEIWVQDYVGVPLDVLPPVPGQRPQPTVSFSMFASDDMDAHAVKLERMYNKILFESESDTILKTAVSAFDASLAVASSFEEVRQGCAPNPESVRREMLFSKTISAVLSKQNIVDECVAMAKAGYGCEEGGRIAALQKGVAKINEWEEKNASFGAINKTRMTPSGLIDYEISAISLTKEGNSVVALDKFTGEVSEFTRDDLIGLLRTKNKPDITGIILSLMTIDAYQKLMQGKDAKNYAVAMDIPHDTVVENFMVAFDKPEELQKKIAQGHYNVIPIKGAKPQADGKISFWDAYRFNTEEHSNAPRQMAVTKLNPDAEALVYFAPFDEKSYAALSKLSTFRDEIFTPLYEECKNNPTLKERLGLFRTGAGLDAPSASNHFITDFIKSLVTRDISLSNLEEFLEDIKDDKAKHAYWSERFEELKDIQAAHDAKVKTRHDELALQEEHAQNIIARGRQSEKAYALWKDIHALPREQQAAAQLKAFCPSVADDIADDAVTQEPAHDYIALAVDSWKAARKENVQQNLGDMTDIETALMDYSIKAAEDTMRYIIMMELAAYDPTILMRRERGIYMKYLDKSSLSGKKLNGAMDAISALEGHLDEWFDWREGIKPPYSHPNLLDVVTYNVPEGGKDEQSYHHHYTHFYCMSDFFLNAKTQKSKGLSGMASWVMGRNAPRHLEKDIMKAINSGNLDSLGITQARFDDIIALSTKIANRPAETKDLFKGNSLLTGSYVRFRCEGNRKPKPSLQNKPSV